MTEPASEPRPEPEPQVERAVSVERRPGGRASMVCALLCLAAAVLALMGSFQDLVVAEQRGVGFQERMRWVISIWDAEIEANGALQPQAPARVAVNGIPLVVAVVLLLAAAILQTPVARRFRRIGGLVAVAGAAFLSAVALLVALQAEWWMSIFQPVSTGSPGDDAEMIFDGGFGSGVWTLIVAAGLAVAATVPAWRGPRPEVERVEPDTPRLGTPLVVRLPDEPQDKPPAV